MSKPLYDQPRNERALQALFEATAATASPAQLRRLARRAAALPEAQSVGGWHRLATGRWPAISLAATGAMALAGALWMQPGDHADSLAPSPLAMAVPPALAPALGSAGSDGNVAPTSNDEADELQLLEDVGVAWLQTDDTEETEAAAVEIDPLAALDLGGGVHDPLGPLDLLHPPQDPAALTRWTSAMEEIIGRQPRGG